MPLANSSPIKALLIPSFLIAALLSTAGAEPSGRQSPSAEEKQVIDAMQSMFAALAAKDPAKFRGLVTPDFYAFDGGKRFYGDALVELIQKAQADGTVFVWSVTEPSVHVDGNTAWITYVNEGSIQNSSGTKKMTWLESAVLRKAKENGVWRVQFLHSTRTPESK